MTFNKYSVGGYLQGPAQKLQEMPKIKQSEILNNFQQKFRFFYLKFCSEFYEVIDFIERKGVYKL